MKSRKKRLLQNDFPMPSCKVRGNQRERQKKRKKTRQHLNKNKKASVPFFIKNRISKRLAKNIIRENMNTNLVKIKTTNYFDKRKYKRNNINVQKTNENSTSVSKNKVRSNSIVIVSDSDMETDDVIEIQDSVLETVNENNTESKKEEVIIVLDDSQNEQSETSCLKEQSNSTPNSIVVVVSNTKNTSEAEVINIDDSVIEVPDSTSNNSGDIREHVDTLSSHSSVKNNQPNIPKECDFIPLITPAKKPNYCCREKNSEYLQNIKITVSGSDRSFQNVKRNDLKTIVPSRNTKVQSSTNVRSSASNNLLLPKITVGSIFGGNLYNAGHTERKGLRDIVIDGSNVAMGHSLGKFFSVKGLKICIDYFLQRGHKVKAFVPHFRIKHGNSSEPALLRNLHEQGHVVLTPSRIISGKKITCYDDRLLVQCAAELEAVVVSGDNYRDLMRENPNLRETIEKRLLIPTWVDDIIMFPSDPLGRFGPSLDQFLKFP